MFLRSLIKIALLIFIITFNFVSTSIAKDISLEDSIEPFCKGKNPEIFFNDQEIKKIEILTNNKRAWFRNLMNALVKFNTNKSKSVHKDWFTFRINDAFKERFDSKVKVSNVVSSSIVAKLQLGIISFSLLFKIIGPDTVSNTICLSISIITSLLYLAT